MTPFELVMKAFDSEAGWDLLDNLMVLRLKQSRDVFIKERERLDSIKANRELNLGEEEEWESLVQDIVALNRVMEIYGGYSD